MFFFSPADAFYILCWCKAAQPYCLWGCTAATCSPRSVLVATRSSWTSWSCFTRVIREETLPQPVLEAPRGNTAL